LDRPGPGLPRNEAGARLGRRLLQRQKNKIPGFLTKTAGTPHTGGKPDVTRELRNHGSGFVEDALVVGFVGGDDVVGAEFLLGVDAGAMLV
jgi:hypothetical protein